MNIDGHAADDPNVWLGATRYVDRDHPQIRQTARRLTWGQSEDRAKALAIFAFVRDEIRFGFASGFWDNRASDVLAARLGYCNTKSTLMVALLRAAGIPARQVFVDIDSRVLGGILDPVTPYVDHSYVEVLLNSRWIATDAYIVDSPLFRHAHARLQGEQRLLGYGVHATGTSLWTGHEPSFSQYNILDPQPIGTRHWGVFADVGDFYARSERPWNRLNAILRAGFLLLASGANGRAEQIRRQTPADAAG